MRTDRIDELKKIELDIYDNEYEKELNSFLSYVKIKFLIHKNKIPSLFYSLLIESSNK